MFIIPMSPMQIQTSLEPKIQDLQTSTSETSVPFADVFASALANARETQAIVEQDAVDLALGKSDDLHTVMINAQKATAALELTVSLTSKAVSAYNEVMRMQF
ncbi:MAG: flagellar hook-basal body complex protein FliE [Erysipelotrichaceae bacterium]